MATAPSLLVHDEKIDKRQRKRETREYDFVAVHGLGGNRAMSWTSYGEHDESEMWLDDVLPTMFYQPGIMTFDYQLNSQRNIANDIQELALNLLDNLEKRRKETNSADRGLVFIGHDIGGLIIKKALTMAFGHERFFLIAISTVSILFFGTPHRAPDDTSWLNLACNLLVISRTNNSEKAFSECTKALAATLKRINREFGEISRAYRMVSVYEKDRLVPPAHVIDKYSAIYGTANEGRRCLQKTHCELPKLSTKIHEEKELLELIVKQVTDSPKRPAEYFQFLHILRSLGVGEKDRPAPSSREREPETLNWLQKNPTYQVWRGAESNGVLCIQGSRGSGKSMLASHIADLAFRERISFDKEQVFNPKETEVLYFSFDTKDETQRNTFTMFTALSYQLLCCRPNLFSHVERIFNIFIKADKADPMDERSKVRVDRLWVLFRSLVTCPGYGGLVCILDSVDKCNLSEDKCLENYIMLCRSIRSGLRLIITTSRGGKIQNVPEEAHIDLDSLEEHRADVRKFVQIEAQQLTRRRPAYTGFLERIESLFDGPSMTFGTAKLTFELLHQIQVPSTARSTGHLLDSLSGKVEGIYDRMMSINQGTNSIWGQRVLSWMMHAIRPLTVSEMSLALALGTEDRIPSFNEIQADIAEDLVVDLDQSFGGLIHIQDGQVQFIHNTFLDYLLEKHKGACSTYCLLCVDHHPIIARLCLNYFSMVYKNLKDKNNESITDPNAELTRVNVPHDAFLAYAIKYWPVHYRKAAVRACDQTSLNFDQFFDNKSLTDAWADQFWHHQNHLTRAAKDTLSIAVEVGCSDLVKKLLDPSRLGMATGAQGDALAIAIEKGHIDLIGETLKLATHPQALHIAASHGRLELFPILKERPGSAMTETSKYTPLQNAAESGNVSVVEEILRGVDDLRSAELINAVGDSGETALHEASRFGHADVIKRLLTHADPNIANSDWQTPLHLACLWQQPSVVEILLDERLRQRIRLDAVDGNKRTALHFAAEAGRIDIVKMILCFYNDEMVKSEALQMKDDKGRTPLHLAALHGHEKVVHLILSNTSSPPGLARLIDDSGSAPLHLAIGTGNMDIVHKLLEFSSEQISSMDKSQNIPIHLAVSRGHTMIVERLCGEHMLKGASLDVFNSESLTPLHIACGNGCTHIVEILLRYHAEAEIAGPNGETPLLVVCRKGYDDIARLLLDCFADTMGVDNHGSSPLHLASGGGSEALVELLLSHNVDVDQKDEEGRAPIHLAAYNGHEGVVRMLLNYDADPTIPDAHGRSLLQYACQGGNRALVEFLIHLLGSEALGNLDEDKQTLLHAAAWGGKHDIVKLLLDRGADPNPPDNNNRTPLDQATDQGVIKILLQRIPPQTLNEEKLGRILLASAKKGHYEVVETLLSKNVDPNITNDERQTPLHLAALENHVELASLLLNHPATEPDKPDDYCRTPLSYAAERGSTKIVQMVLNLAPKVDPDSKDNRKRTPLHFSAELGRLEVVRQILDKAGSEENTVIDIDGKDEEGVTPLWLAVPNGHHEVARALLSRGADPNITNKEGDTTLHYAARNGLAKVTAAILESGKLENGNARDSEGRTALYLAAYYGKAETFSVLINSPVDLDIKITGPCGWRPLHAAYDSLPIVRLILKYTRNDEIDFPNRDGETALYLSIRSGWEPVAKELLQNGADPLKAANNGMTPLHEAAGRKGATFFPFVLSKIPLDKDLNVEDTNGQTPLTLAIASQNLNAARALLQRDGFGFPFPNDASIRVIEKAIETGSTAMFMLLMNDVQGSSFLADISEQETDKLVLKAFKTGDEKMCTAVLDKLPGAKATTNEIFNLVVVEQPGLAGLLLHRGVDPVKSDKHGWPLAWIHVVYKATQESTDCHSLPAANFIEPSSWNPEDKHSNLELVEESGMTLGVKYRDDIHGELDELRFSLSRAFSLRQELYRRRLNSRPAGCVRADHPIPPNRKFYFEVKIISVKQASLRFRIFRNVAIGFSHSNSTLDGLPGYRETKSWGYNGDDGKLYSTGAAVPGVRCDTFGEVGDVVGCCIDPTDGTAFFTKNGERQDGLIRGIHGKIFPLVYIMGGVEVRAYFPAQKASFLFDINTVSGGECFTP